MKHLSLILISLFLAGQAFGQSCKDVSVELSAVVQNSPPKITLNWVGNGSATLNTVYRKLKTDAAWGNAMEMLNGEATQFVDSLVTVGVSYEYEVTRTASSWTGYGYINTGIAIPVTEARGILILIVDSTFAGPLVTELKRLENDLEGDGWKIIRHNVSRTAAVTAVKALIVTDYNLDQTNTKAVFLVGHVPVPYSGNLNPDGHPNHQGAWPADVYYGDMDGSWTDNYVNNTAASDSRNDNVPGDGKFDQSSIPSDIELQTGRVDFANMPAFAASGWKNLGPLVGPANVAAADYFTTLADSSYLWSYGCGGGTFTSAGGIGNTTDFAAANLHSVFTMLFGSYFGDWDSQNNFLRAPLAQGTCLTNVWSGRPHWVFHHMAMGENIGYDVRISQNNTTLYFSSYAGRFVDNALMGDPSLRNDIIAPVSDVIATITGTNCMISWTPSSDIVLGYNIYRKNDSIPDYVIVNQNIITTNTYTDSCMLFPGVYTYMVRAIALQTSPSGTYYNLSQGITDTAWNSNYLVITASPAFAAQANLVSFTNNTINATTFSWNFGDGGTSTLPNPSHAFLDGNYTVTLVSSNGCYSDTSSLTISILTGLEKAPDIALFSVFPNPSSGRFIILGNAGQNVFDEASIYNSSCELIMVSQNCKSPYNLDLSLFPAGNYLLKVICEKKTYTQTLIVQ